VKKGAIVVLRPDGWVATAVALKIGAVEELEGYFGKVLIMRNVGG
jgi:phenol 2-monooxygenase